MPDDEMILLGVCDVDVPSRRTGQMIRRTVNVYYKLDATKLLPLAERAARNRSRSAQSAHGAIVVQVETVMKGGK